MKTRLILSLIASVYFTGYADDIEQALEEEKQAQTATAITIIFDTSGSMEEENKMAEAKSAFSTWLKELPTTYSLGLLDFAQGSGRVVVPIGRGDGQRDSIAGHVSGARPYGKTPIVQCLQLAREAIAKRREEFSPYERHVVVVFTDGYETVNPNGTRGVLKEILALRSEIVEVVGIGFHGQGAYMKPAATRYMEADNEQELVQSLLEVDAEIGDDTDIEITDKDLAAMQALKAIRQVAPGGEKE